MKKAYLMLMPSLFFVISCKPEAVPINRIETLLQEARQGFNMVASSTRTTINSLTNKEISKDITKYDYIFDNHERAKVKQTVTTNVQEEQSVTVNFVRDDEGFLAQEYVNYKNELDLYLFKDDSGSKVPYDSMFINPFKLLNELDFIQDETNSDLYHLNPKKIARFEYYTVAKNCPTKDITFLFNENELNKITIISERLEGKAYLEESKSYVKANWTYEDELQLKDLGEARIDSLAISSPNKYNDEVKEILTKVNDNYSLKQSLHLDGFEADPSDVHTIYFDKDKCYVDMDMSVEDISKDELYKKDKFKDDDLLYKHIYDSESSKWVLEPVKEAYSYNLLPENSSYFIPNMKDIDPSLITKNEKYNYYTIANDYAKSFIGSGFLSDFDALPYFDEGYGDGAFIKYDKTKEEINIELPFAINLYGDIQRFIFEVTYFNIGNTKLPIEL